MGGVWRVVDERDTGVPQRDKRGRKWGEMGVKGKKESFVCHVIMDAESRTRKGMESKGMTACWKEGRDGGERQERCYGFW